MFLFLILTVAGAFTFMQDFGRTDDIKENIGTSVAHLPIATQVGLF
jgi:hypothetical protein